MNARPRLVFDTNTIISRLLLPASLPAQAARKGVDEGQLLASDATLMELADVLSRPKFDSYISLEDRQEFFRIYGRIIDKIPIIKTVHACKDPKDNKFLELAVNGEASYIITGDRDLLELNPFRTIQIITPARYVTGA